ncbi:MAG: 6-phosphogluconolactonase [Acetobacteraceae bacterium]|nr:6-phosphogluconolactonase [Acetobacteraceae bacterium]
MPSSLPWFSRPPHSLAVLPVDGIAEVAAARVVDALRAALARRGRAVLAPSAGRTPRPTYALLRAAHRSSLDWSRVVCVQMDEYEGVGDRDPRGFAAELRRELVEPLGIGRFQRFHDGEGELRVPLDAYERAVRGMGGIDCAVHGVGRNGHVAFNEPGDMRAEATRRVRLARSTRVANGVLFTRGVTLGLDVLAEAREALVLMTGAAKRDAAAAVLFRAGGRDNPAAAIRRCGRVSVLLDPEAAPGLLLGHGEPATPAGGPPPAIVLPSRRAEPPAGPALDEAPPPPPLAPHGAASEGALDPGGRGP